MSHAIFVRVLLNVGVWPGFCPCILEVMFQSRMFIGEHFSFNKSVHCFTFHVCDLSPNKVLKTIVWTGNNYINVPDSIAIGPLLHFSCMRFESKQSFENHRLDRLMNLMNRNESYESKFNWSRDLVIAVHAAILHKHTYIQMGRIYNVKINKN
uniref:uncharacterized protein LOC108950574 n=1 Tax=Ciona intestinalis TaxID=7719 RepID=UPI000EF4D179|nr:uncharacterized protein LOC108950574 [Ciona intestinalis]|eukprot:XP_018672091.2 uncharacterized protein LOC108950574 [Ciona intestinalis]